jgi:hypothetical protein
VGHLEQHTFGAVGAAAAAGAGLVMNAPKNLTLAALGPGSTGPLPLPFLVPVPVASFLIEIEPGRRPARPPPPTVAFGAAMAGRVGRRAVREPKKRRRSSRLVQRAGRGPSGAHLKMELHGTFT